MGILDPERIRAGIPALANCIYLNTGTFGPLPTVVVDEIRRVYCEIERQGTFSPPVFRQMEVDGYEAVRGQVARLLGASADEIALTRNVTDGVNIVLNGLDWRPGDEVILTDQEHSAGIIPALALAERLGVRVRWLELLPDADEILIRFQRLLTSRTRLAYLSHVSCMTGLRLPVARLCAVARQAGVLSLVDGAHAEGQFAVDVQELGCDFYAACGHKWLLGPQGVGMLYLRREHVERLRPVWLGWGVDQTLDRAGQRFTLVPTAARFEQSTRAWPLYLAFGKAIEFIEGVGLPAIEARVRVLRARFLAGLAALPGVTLRSPADSGLASGLVTVSIPCRDCEALHQHLWDTRRILAAFNREYQALRFSLAFFTATEELDLVLEALEDAIRPAAV